MPSRFPDRSGRGRLGWAWLLGILLWAGAAGAQEALINSLAGETAAEAAKQAVANQYYNVKAGALKLRFTSAISMVGDDNVDLTEDHRRADISARPEVDMTAYWPVTEQNALTFTVGLGYAKYLRTSRLDHYFLSPNSLLQFNISAGDFLINLHNQFTYQQDAYQTSEISGTGSYGYFQNTTGVNVIWHLNKLVVTFGYDHSSYTVSDTANAYQNHSSELLSARIAFELNQTSQAGLELGGGSTAYDVKPSYTNVYAGFVSNNITGATNSIFNRQPAYAFLSDQKYVNAGPFLRLGLSPYMHLRLSAGYAIYFQDVASSFGKAGNSAAFYTDFQLDHIVNSHLNYTFNAGHQIRQGLLSDSLDIYFIQLTPTWKVLRDVTLSTPFAYETVKSASGAQETYQDYSFSLQANYQLTKKLNLGGNYTYREKKSNLRANSYFQNQLVLNLQYSF